MNTGFIRTSDPKWRSLLDRLNHDFYHLPAYVELSALQEGGTSEAFWAEEGTKAILIPLLIKELPETLRASSSWCDAQSPYGYPGPLISRSCDMASLSQFLDLFREACQRRGLVSAFIRLHPLLPFPAYTGYSSRQLVLQGQTVYIDLRLGLQELWRQTWSGHRSDIQKLQESGYHTVIDDWNRYPDFVSIYEATMRRLDAARFYFFSQTYFDALRHALGDRLHLAAVLSPSGETMAAGLFPCMNGLMQYHLSGSSEALPRIPATKLLLYSMTQWAKENGCHTLHLGGGVGSRQDSLFKFKTGFSPLLADFYTLRLVLDEEKYRVLVEKRRLMGEDDLSDFFPQYRAPVPAPAKAQTSCANRGANRLGEE